MNILMATWEGGGNVSPMVGAAQRLLARGHRVRLMADEAVRREADRAGIAFRPWTTAPNRADRSAGSDIVRDWESGDDLGGFMLLRDRIMCGPAPAYAADFLEELAREPADAVVASEMLFGVMVAAEAAGLPLALLCSNLSVFPLPGLPPMGAGLRPAATPEERAAQDAMGAEFGRLLDRGLPAVNTARQAGGLGPIPTLAAQVGAARRILLATSPAFDFAATRLPPPFRYVGPILTEPDWVAGSPEPALTGAPLVVIAFSSTFQDQAGPIARACAAVADLPIQAVVTLGPALTGLPAAVPANVAVVRGASHTALMGRAAVVVTHGGHGTVLRALRHGVPLLCLPMGRDQHDNAARVEAHGVGLRLDRGAPPEAIRAAIVALLDQPSFRAAAKGLGRAIAEGAGCADLVAEIEALPG